jgi:beta-lactam-binding protein with PASTA domain
VERDLVIAQAPQAGSPLEKSGMISVLVSSGKRPSALITPRLVGKKMEEAITIIERMGLQHHVAYRAAGERTQAQGRVVLSQKPAAGYPILTEGTLELSVSK